MRLRIGGCTHRGAVRCENQDAFLAGDRLIQEGEAEEYVEWPVNQLRWVAVADGMGGHDDGDVASRMALEALAAVSDASQEKVRIAMEGVHKKMTELGNLGTTLTAIALKGTRPSLVHVGDSRLYRHTDGCLTLLTPDDAIESGALTACVGGGFHGPLEWTWSDTLGFEPGCRFLLCTDGLARALTAQTIERVIRQSRQTPEQNLVEAAVAAGAADNVTALVVEFLEKS